MTNVINGIGDPYGNGVGGYGLRKKQDNTNGTENNTQTNNANNAEQTQIDPNKVMEFLANNNYFMPVQVENPQPTVETGNVDIETQERIAEYMARFEEIYSIVEQEFGTELAPAVMDLVMDKLMGMA